MRLHPFGLNFEVFYGDSRPCLRFHKDRLSQGQAFTGTGFRGNSVFRRKTEQQTEFSNRIPISKKLLLLVIGQFLASYPVMGAEKVFPSKDINSLIIQVPSLNLKVKQSNSPNYTLKGSEGLDFQIETGKLFIKSQDFSFQKAWSNKNAKKSLNLEISGPSKDLQVFSFVSHISISGWTQPVFISSFKSQITSNHTKGSWQISLKEGAVNMTKHKSPLKIKSLQARLNINRSEGDFDFQVNEGKITVRKSKGQVSFTNDKSKIQLTQFIGSLKGFSRLGSIRAGIQANQVNVSTEEGTVRLYFIKQGPKVKAYTEKGKIYAPKYFYKKFSGKSTHVSGQMKSTIKKGQVSVKTERGNIYIN